MKISIGTGITMVEDFSDAASPVDASKIQEDTKKHIAELNALAGKFYANFMKVLGVR